MEGNESDSLHWNVQDVLRYSQYKPLDHWQDTPFLFLIGHRLALERIPTCVNSEREMTSSMWESKRMDPPFWAPYGKAPNGDAPLTLILDGWDELFEEPDSRRQLIGFLINLDSSCRSRLRLRISSRPELPEQDILGSLRRNCAWLFSNLKTEGEENRLVLGPLCRDQVESLWSQLGNGEPASFLWVSQTRCIYGEWREILCRDTIDTLSLFPRLECWRVLGVDDS